MNLPGALIQLNLHLALLPGIDWKKVELPNRKLDSQTTRYWKVALIPAGNAPEIGGGSAHEKGIYQVSILTPSGTGIAEALQDAQAVVDHFKLQNLSGVMCGVPTIGPSPQQPDWLHTPVSVGFQIL